MWIRGLNNKINRIYERTPSKIRYKDNLLRTIRKRQLRINKSQQKLAVEIYKVLHGFSSPILNYLFVPVSRPYNFPQNDTLQRQRVNSARHGTESISFLGPRIWDLVPSDIKLSQSLSIFKRKIKKWVILQRSCRLCKIYLHVWFIQWTPEKSLHLNRGVPLSVSLINV